MKKYTLIMLMSAIIATLTMLVLMSGCQPKPTLPMPYNTSDRFKVERVAVIEDDLAYHDRRGIYLIKDTKTGQEFIGVSGIGVSELGTHAAGKAILPDER